MKKFLLFVPLMLLFALGISSCNNQNGWNQQQRKELRDALKDYRKMVHLNQMTDAEYDAFAHEVAHEYPVYTSFIQMQGAADTVDVMVVETIVQELNEDARNMRRIYPYNFLVEQGILPQGLTLEQQHQFYKCFAGKVNTTFTMQQFVIAILNDTTDKSKIRQMESQCANDLFDWVVAEVEVVETAN